MIEGRDSASARVAVVVLFLLVVTFHYEVAQAAIYIVGDSSGWTANVSGWENGKNFKVGDVLVFNYQKGAHNVVVVNKAGYDGCSIIPRGAKVYNSGHDKIKLVKGPNNFICGLPGHCGAGMKLQISASKKVN